MSAHLADATCRRGERCLYLAFEESKDQIVRNMRSIGLDLQHMDRPRASAHRVVAADAARSRDASRARPQSLVAQFEPRTVIIDPISNFATAGVHSDARRDAASADGLPEVERHHPRCSSIWRRWQSALEATEIGVSSLIDTWIIVRDIEAGGERNRGLYVIKSRGMRHSNQSREFPDHRQRNRPPGQSTSARKAC
jgi:circadian clock protein KaiC